MSVDPHWLVLGVICLLSSVFFAVVSLWRKGGTRFAPVAAVDALVLGAMFVVLAALPLSSWRAEVLGAALPELVFNIVLSSICLAQAGRRGSGALGEAIRRPRLQAVLASAPAVLLCSWFAALAIGLVWPVPALDSQGTAGPMFVLFRWTLVVPQMLYAGLVAWAFWKASGPHVPARRLRVKNLLFFVGTFAWFLGALNSTIHGAVRLLVPDGTREAVVLAQNVLEQFLILTIVVAYGAGLTLRYAPTIKEAAVRRVYIGWMRLHERFESRRWQLVSGGKVRGLIRASHHVSRAGVLLGLPDSDLEKALTTLELTAILANPSLDVREEVTPEKARELLALQKRLLNDGELAAVVGQPPAPNHDDREAPSTTPIPSHGALEAALALAAPSGKAPADGGARRSLWYHLVTVAAVDARMIPPEKPEGEEEFMRRRALRAYRTAKDSGRSSVATGE